MTWIDGFVSDLTDDEKMVRDVARQFAVDKVLPLAAELDREHRFPKELIPELGSLGFLGAMTAEEYGGSALSTPAYCFIVEELAAACASTAIIVSAHNSLCLAPIQKFGTEDQKKRYLPPLASGANLGCFALSEPGTGSDAASLTCSYVKKGNEYVLNGTKNWITNGPDAQTCVLLAMGDASLGHKGVSAFVHSLDMEGITLGKREEKLGIRASGTCSITYTDVILSKENLLGNEGQGFKIAMETLNGGRLGVASQAVGIARAALRDALNYSKERKTFGKPIGKHQSIQNYLADMSTGIDAARLLTVSGARAKDRGENYIRIAAQAKLHASEVAVSAALKGIQIHGGYGYVTEYPAERHLRDAKICEIYEGTSEVQRMVIASSLFNE